MSSLGAYIIEILYAQRPVGLDLKVSMRIDCGSLALESRNVVVRVARVNI